MLGMIASSFPELRTLNSLMTLIKNCGLKTPDSVAHARATGASFAGFVHYAPSPRHLSIPDMAALFKHVPLGLARVIVLVDPSDELLATLPRADYIQLHNVSNYGRVNAISTLTKTPLITAIRVRSKDDLATARPLEELSAHLLFDAYHDTEIGGSGHAFDWKLLHGLKLTKPWFLAGGLTQTNVAEAIRTTHAPMVDVSSGIESTPGIKSLEKIAAFNAAVVGG